MFLRSVGAIILVSVVGLVAALLVYWFLFAPVVVEGTVIHKAVTGVRGSVSYTILVNRPAADGSWIIVKDRDYRGLFGRVGNVVVDDYLESMLKGKYSEVRYIVSIRVEGGDPVNGVREGETLAYQASREFFNMVGIGDRVRFPVSRFEAATALDPVEVIHPANLSSP